MSSSTKASARLAPWFRTAERTQTAQKKRTRARHPRCTLLRHSRHTRGQLKHRTRTCTIKPRGMILFFTVIYNTHDHRNTDRPVLSSPSRSSRAFARLELGTPFTPTRAPVHRRATRTPNANPDARSRVVVRESHRPASRTRGRVRIFD